MKKFFILLGVMAFLIGCQSMSINGSYFTKSNYHITLGSIGKKVGHSLLEANAVATKKVLIVNEPIAVAVQKAFFPQLPLASR